MNKIEVYLGDGLYASFDGYQIKLCANSANEPTDMVYLNLSVIEALFQFAKHYVWLERREGCSRTEYFVPKTTDGKP